MRPKKKIYDFYSKEHKDFIERIFNAVNDNIIDSEVVDNEGYIDQFEAHHGCDFYMYNNYYPLTALSKGSYQFGDTERKAVDEFVDRCYKDAEKEGVDLEENDYENEFDWFKDEFDYESQYGWYVRFYLDFGEYPDYPEDGYVLYAEFADGLGNKHKSDNTAFITMNDGEDTIEKKVSRFMDNLKFSDKDKLKESKKIVRESKKVVKENKVFSKIVVKIGDIAMDKISEIYEELPESEILSSYIDKYFEDYVLENEKLYNMYDKEYDASTLQNDYDEHYEDFVWDVVKYIKQTYSEQINESKKVVKRI